LIVSVEQRNAPLKMDMNAMHLIAIAPNRKKNVHTFMGQEPILRRVNVAL